jgi:predicted secreted acid phosphatase
MSEAEKPQAIIVDIDGTIADCSHRAIHVNNLEGRKNWSAFNSRMHLDEPKHRVLAIVQAMADKGVAVILLTGRFNEFKSVTLDWLGKHGVPFNTLIMRPDKDFRSDHVIKEELYEKCIQPFFDVVFVLDDRDSVVEMWRARGLCCLQVQKGDY